MAISKSKAAHRAPAFQPNDSALLRSIHSQSWDRFENWLQSCARPELVAMLREEIRLKNSAIYFIIESGQWSAFEEYSARPMGVPFA